VSIVDRAVKSLGLRQRAYQGLFGEGSPSHHILTELALYAKAFEPDTDGIGHDMLMTMHGRRQMFFHIVNHLKLSTNELEAIYISVATRSAQRFTVVQGATE